MPLFTRTFAIVAGLLSVPVFGAAVIGANYNSPFLTHLIDIVNGSRTATVVSTNAPNWSFAAPLAKPIATSVATTAGGSVASSTKLYFAVAALDGTGTTTISNTLSATTDASSTHLAAEAFEVKWGSVTGATGYAVYFGSSPSALSNYFLSTTSNAFYLSTTTVGQLSGSYTDSDTSAFSFKLNPIGSSFIDGGNGTATSTTEASTTALQINGNFTAQAPATTTNCYAGTAGVIFYNTANNHEWGCNGTAWQKIF